MALARLVAEELFLNANDLVIAVTPNDQNRFSLSVTRNGGTHKPLLNSGPVFEDRERAIDRLEGILMHEVAEFCISELDLDIAPGRMTRAFVTRIIDRLQSKNEVNTGAIVE